MSPSAATSRAEHVERERLMRTPKLIWAAVLAATMTVGLSSIAQARTATVYEGYSSRVGQLKSSGTGWTVYQGYSSRLGQLKRSGSDWTVYEGYSTRVGTVKCSG